MKKVFFTLLTSLLLSNFCFAQDDDLTPAQLTSISKVMKEIMDMSKKNNEVIAFEFLITNGEYSLKNAIVQKGNNWVSDSAKEVIEKSYDGFRKDFIIFIRKDILICDNEEPACLGYAVMGCDTASESNCYKIFYIP